MKNLIVIVLIAIAAIAGWFLGRGKSGSAPAAGERKVSFYQSPMHPWIKSDKPGDISLEGGKVYTVNFALHDDYANARFHHVSLEFRFGLDMKEAEINAAKR